MKSDGNGDQGLRTEARRVRAVDERGATLGRGRARMRDRERSPAHRVGLRDAHEVEHGRCDVHELHVAGALRGARIGGARVPGRVPATRPPSARRHPSCAPARRRAPRRVPSSRAAAADRRSRRSRPTRGAAWRRVRREVAPTSTRTRATGRTLPRAPQIGWSTRRRTRWSPRQARGARRTARSRPCRGDPRATVPPGSVPLALIERGHRLAASLCAELELAAVGVADHRACVPGGQRATSPSAPRCARARGSPDWPR